MANRNHTLTFGALSALVAALLAGCQGDPKPKFDPDAELSSGSSSVSASPSESAAAKPLDPVQTVRAWVAARNETVQSGDAEGVFQLSTADCKTCRYSVQTIVKVYEAGGRYETFGWRIAKISKSSDWASSHEIGVAIDVTAGKTWLRKNSKPVHYGPTKDVVAFKLRKVASAWLVQSVYYIE